MISKKNLKILFTLIALLIGNFSFSAIVQCQTTPCSWEDLSNSLINLVKTIVLVSFWLAFLLCVIGAFLIMFHGPSPSLYQKGVNLIKFAIISYILILFSGIIFDVILDFFQPKLAIAQDVGSYLNPLKEAVSSELKCGAGKKGIDKIISCIFEAIAVLKNLAIILLTLAIIGSAVYLITTPLFGLKNIGRAYQILIWSIIGLIIILLADVIKAQIELLTK